MYFFYKHVFSRPAIFYMTDLFDFSGWNNFLFVQNRLFLKTHRFISVKLDALELMAHSQKKI